MAPLVIEKSQRQTLRKRPDAAFIVQRQIVGVTLRCPSVCLNSRKMLIEVSHMTR